MFADSSRTYTPICPKLIYLFPERSKLLKSILGSKPDKVSFMYPGNQSHNTSLATGSRASRCFPSRGQQEIQTLGTQRLSYLSNFLYLIWLYIFPKLIRLQISRAPTRNLSFPISKDINVAGRTSCFDPNH